MFILDVPGSPRVIGCFDGEHRTLFCGHTMEEASRVADIFAYIAQTKNPMSTAKRMGQINKNGEFHCVLEMFKACGLSEKELEKLFKSIKEKGIFPSDEFIKEVGVPLGR